MWSRWRGCGCCLGLLRMVAGGGSSRPAMPRVLLLLFVLCVASMMFISRCGLDFEPASSHGQAAMGRRSLEAMPHDGASDAVVGGGGVGGNGQDCGSQLSALQHDLSEKHAEVEQLRQTIANLQSQLQEARQMAQDIITNNAAPPAAAAAAYKEQALKLQAHFEEKLKESEITAGNHFNNEYELFPFSRFTLSRIYLVDPGLGKRVVEKPIGLKKKEINDVVNFAISQMNDGRDGQTLYTSDDFLEGLQRTEPTLGTHTELYFKDIDQTGSLNYRKLTLTRPFGPLQMMLNENMSTNKQVINLILPLKGRLDKFELFMSRFERVCIRHDKRVYLTVVYFGEEGLSEVKSLIGQTSKKFRFKNIKLITLKEDFSRGRGLQMGAQSWTQGDVLMFMCDVDIVFSTDFLERCRLNAKKGSRVYYPMVFSLYNPKVVYSLQDAAIPSDNDQLVISKDTGFWRDFGYGMTCQYRSDFLRVKGFDVEINGWGEEDVYLYRKYVKSDYMVIRATDPGIFHLWHEKVCNPELQPDQYRGCIRSKALNEASHSQLGMLAFKAEIDIHRSINKKKGSHINE